MVSPGPATCLDKPRSLSSDTLLLSRLPTIKSALEQGLSLKLPVKTTVWTPGLVVFVLVEHDILIVSNGFLERFIIVLPASKVIKPAGKSVLNLGLSGKFSIL